MSGIDRTPQRRGVRLPRPRAGTAATGLFLTALVLSAATVPLAEPAPATAGTTQAAPGPHGR